MATVTVHEWLKRSEAVLSEANVSTARLDALVLLEDATGQDRALLLARPDTKLTDARLKILEQQVSRRAAHTPLAYIRGKTEFYGRDFMINEHVLEPRPESETIIDLLKSLFSGAPSDAPIRQQLIVDVGTGSGALAVIAKCELPHNPVMAIDVDPACLEVAKANAATHQADITLAEGDLLAPLVAAQTTEPDRITANAQPLALLCNLPYVPESFHINQAAGHEPRLAIFGGPDGLDPFRRMFEQIKSTLVAQRPQYVITESLPTQHTDLQAIAKAAGYLQQQRDDFVQLFALQQ